MDCGQTVRGEGGGDVAGTPWTNSQKKKEKKEEEET
jgi:hypothetical protein